MLFLCYNLCFNSVLFFYFFFLLSSALSEQAKLVIQDVKWCQVPLGLRITRATNKEGRKVL